MSTKPFKAPDENYTGRTAVLATMHRKQAAIAPVFKSRLGVNIRVPAGIDTDALGTFTGEIARRGDIREAALAKARLGMAATGLPLGIASEGAFGPHPSIPFVAAGMELLIFVDDERGIVISEHLLDEHTNFSHVTVAAPELVEHFLSKVGFPAHGLVVSPNAPIAATPADSMQPDRMQKGVRNRRELNEAIKASVAASADGEALVQTDMRAHQNPTRMAAIGRLADRLAERILCHCPACSMPGFGRVDIVAGLPCESCGCPSTLVAAEIFGCVVCEHRENRPRADGLQFAEPQWCSLCNP
ncbi:hypothetical protein F6455_02910 [Proteobacteria bacterium 005FR1]|nr:hypothetical protein [Proteobacteria bacterium 005FR1]